MHGVSEVIAIILILMITISLAGLAYMFMSTTMSDVTASASSTVDTTTSSMLTSFTIESIDVAKVYVRNTGQNALTSLSVYVNDEPAVFNITPSSILVGQIGTITIYSFIPDGGTVKVTSPSGFSASKVADECSKAVGCWKFDEGTGTTAYDSSPNGNTGVLTNFNYNAVSGWTTSKFGNGLLFDGSNDYVRISNSPPLVNLQSKTVLVLVKLPGYDSQYIWDGGYWNSTGGYGDLIYTTAGNTIRIFVKNSIGGVDSDIVNYVNDTWTLVGYTYNGTHWMTIVNGALSSPRAFTGIISDNSTMFLGKRYDNVYFLNGTIDEVRIYSRAIY